MNIKKFVSYGDGLISAARIYTDSYSEDMFSDNTVYQVRFDELKNKNLIKDIGINNTTCNNANSYITVVKYKKRYVYCLSMNCTDNNGNSVYKYNIKDDASSDNKSSGICNQVKYYKLTYKCNNDSDDKVFDVVSGNVNLNFNICKKKYYYFDSYTVDGTTIDKTSPIYNVTKDTTLSANWREIPSPKVVVNVYKRTSDGGKGDFVKTFNVEGKKSYTINSTDYPNNVNGWLNKATYPYGIYYEFSSSDETGILSKNLEYNNSGSSSYSELTNTKTDVDNTNFHADGKRILKYTVTNK